MKRWFLLVLLFLCVACKGEKCSSYFGEGGEIDLSMPEFLPLNIVGGSVVTTRGYAGICVTRISYSEFVAYDCACPNGDGARLEADDEWGNSVLSCPQCGSRYNTIDGTPLSGSVSGCMLYQYNTAFDGNVLLVY